MCSSDLFPSHDTTKQAIGTILDSIEQRYNVHFIYNSGLINKTKSISLQVNNKSLLFSLQQILGNNNISIVTVNNQIIFKLKKESATINKPQNEQSANKQEICYKQVTIYDTVTTSITDTIIEHITDTQRIIVYDTIRVKNNTNQTEAKSSEKQRKTKSFSLGAWISPQIGINQEQRANTDAALLDSIHKSTSNKVFGGSAALYLSFNIGNFQIGSGVMTRVLSSEIDYNLHITNTTSSTITINYTYRYRDWETDRKSVV